MNDEDKKLDENMENDNREDLPVPEADDEAIEYIDPDYIPSPEADDEYLPDITPEMVREEMMGVDEDGYSRCIIHVELKKIEKFNPEEAEGDVIDGPADGYIRDEDIKGPADEYITYDDDEEEPDNSVPIADVTVEYCRVREYTLDGSIVNLELIFDNPLDKGMQEVHQMLEEYKEMCEAFDKAKLGEGDLPIFTIYFMPVKYPGQAVAAYSQPFAYFKTMGYEQDDERILHMMFPIERTGITCYHVKKAEIEEMEEYIVTRFNEGGII